MSVRRQSPDTIFEVAIIISSTTTTLSPPTTHTHTHTHTKPKKKVSRELKLTQGGQPDRIGQGRGSSEIPAWGSIHSTDGPHAGDAGRHPRLRCARPRAPVGDCVSVYASAAGQTQVGCFFVPSFRSHASTCIFFFCLRLRGWVSNFPCMIPSSLSKAKQSKAPKRSIRDDTEYTGSIVKGDERERHCREEA